jgi:uncharacterized protein (DUF58 family)
MIRPTRRCVLLFAAAFPAALLPALVALPLWRTWAMMAAAGGLAVAADLALVLGPERLRLGTRLPETLFIGEDEDLEATVSVAGGRGPLSVELLFDLGGVLRPQHAVRLALRGTAPAQARIRLDPALRGQALVEAAWLRWAGPLGLVERLHQRPLDQQVPVVPNTRAVQRAAAQLLGPRSLLYGPKVERYVGEGSEFESLREYAPGLDLRAIDWKASARHMKLLAREYRSERNHQVVLAFDTGHLMSEPLGAIPRLDHAINAGLLVGYVALKSGDRLGLFAFDERIRLHVEPRGGVASFQPLQQRSAELAYSTAETNFTRGLTELGRLLRRRSLILVFTDFADTVSAELMIENIGRLARRHLILFVALRDPFLDRVADAAPRSVDAMSRAVVARDLVRERDVVLSRLRRRGVHCLDAPPNAISPRLIRRYLEIKRRELV